jgi:hypothetical protein
MKRTDLNSISTLYENAIFIARADDLSAEPLSLSSGSDSKSHPANERDPSEIHMAKADLMKLSEYASELSSMLDNVTGLEGWVASKITKAADYISSVKHWLEYEQHQQPKDCGCEF